MRGLQKEAPRGTSINTACSNDVQGFGTFLQGASANAWTTSSPNGSESMMEGRREIKCEMAHPERAGRHTQQGILHRVAEWSQTGHRFDFVTRTVCNNDVQGFGVSGGGASAPSCGIDW